MVYPDRAPTSYHAERTTSSRANAPAGNAVSVGEFYCAPRGGRNPERSKTRGRQKVFKWAKRETRDETIALVVLMVAVVLL